MTGSLRFLGIFGTALGLLAFACASSNNGSGATSSPDGSIDDLDAGDGGDAEKDEDQQAILRTGGSGAGCEDVPDLAIGTFGDAGVEPKPVPNGTREDATVVAVNCRVIPANGGYSVYATVGRSGTTFELEANVDSNGATTAGGVSLIGPAGTWQSETCTLSQTSPQMGVTTGRYWAVFSCPASTSTPNVTCDLFGEVRVENCTTE